jgi:hypothetical protein
MASLLVVSMARLCPINPPAMNWLTQAPAASLPFHHLEGAALVAPGRGGFLALMSVNN